MRRISSKPSRKESLARSLWPLVLAIALQAALATFSFSVLTSVRAYVAGEGYWSKGQKDAVYYLTEYLISGNEQDFALYQRAVAVPLADRTARLALESNLSNVTVARNGLLGGRNNPDDVGGMIWLFRNFRWWGPFHQAVDCWRATDSLLGELASLGNSIHRQVVAKRTKGGHFGPSIQYTSSAIGKIESLNRRLTSRANAFSSSLGYGSREIAEVLTAINLIIAVFLILIAGWHMRRLLLQRQEFESALNSEKERALTTLSSLGEAVISVDADGAVEYLNRSAEQLLEISLADAKGIELSLLVHLCDPETETKVNFSARYLFEALPLVGEPRLLMDANGKAVAVSVTAEPIKVESSVVGAVLVLHDKTAEQNYIERISWQASHDELTQIPNRRYFERRLENIISGLSKRPSSNALMFLDLDQFKIVNDTCGHTAGDCLLQQVVAELRSHLRAEDLLARLGGDEFAVIIEDCYVETAATAAERLRQAIEQLNFVWSDRTFRVTVSIGLLHFNDASLSLKDVLGAADVACYMAKQNGRNRVQIHSPSDAELQAHVGEMSWFQRIQDALDGDRFCLHGQKIASLDDGSTDVFGMEFLVRMVGEADELIMPNSFIPAAERFGIMRLIDRWVISNAFQTIAEWEATGRATPVFYGINLSGASLDDGEMAPYIEKQMELLGIKPNLISFEITETNAIRDIRSAEKFMRALRKLGCEFALDDFGTGLSSFAYLKRLPVDTLKIDGTFVQHMLDDPDDRAMVEMIAQMAKIMGKATVAEFVECEAVFDTLKEMGVDYAQGYAVGKPEPLEAFGMEELSTGKKIEDRNAA